MADEIVEKRTRPDRKEAMSVHTEPGDNRKYLNIRWSCWIGLM